MFIFFSYKNNLTKNIINIVKFQENERIEKIYGYCGQESIGFLQFIKKKYNLKGNPEIINYVHTPQVLWSIYDAKFNKYKNNYKIILNYPGKYFQVNLSGVKNNIFEFKDPYYFSTISKKIKKIYSKNPNFKIYGLEFYKNDYTNKAELIKKIDINSNINDKYDLNIDINEFLINENRLFIKILSNQIYNKDSILKLELENILDLNKFEIIEEYKNCYFLK